MRIKRPSRVVKEKDTKMHADRFSEEGRRTGLQERRATDAGLSRRAFCRTIESFTTKKKQQKKKKNCKRLRIEGTPGS